MSYQKKISEKNKLNSNLTKLLCFHREQLSQYLGLMSDAPVGMATRNVKRLSNI